MAKIKQIEIKNFKFFPDDVKPLVLKDNSDHVLLYGENGSGKSTLNWALYTLLESANKSNPADIVKYFDERDPQNLLNIHAATRSTDAFVKVTLDDGALWEISNYAPTINSNTDAQNSNLASDFINYRLLYRLLDFRNSQDIDLFQLFETEVFDYLTFDTPTKVVSHKPSEIIVGKVWNQIKDGPLKVTVAGSIIPQFPTTGTPFLALRDGIAKFQKELSNIIDSLNAKANAILKNDLEIDLEFRLKLEEERVFDIKPDIYTPPKYRIDLIIEKVAGKTPPTTNIKPHIFLNEARLKAIGLAIRLSVLEKRLSTAKLKLLVLDDLLISLDMSNRMKVVDMILKHYCDRYQVLMMTHDRSFFELVRFKIKQKGEAKKWNFWEFYSYIAEGKGYEQPLFIDESPDYLEKAKLYFGKKDYPTCANYQRKWCEQFLKSYLQENYRLEIGPDDTAISITKLETLFNRLKSLYKDCRVELPKSIEDGYPAHRETIMNPFSHDDLGSPVFRYELEQGFTLIEEFKKLKPLRKSVIAYRDDIIKYTEPSLDYISRFQIKSEPLTLINHGGDISIMGRGDVLDYTENGAAKPAPPVGMSNLSVSDFCEKIAKYLTAKHPKFTPNSDMFQSLILSTKSISLRQIIDG
jgi:energy-coupling factor transporter ATP-binding protein EcfA2